jgi:hypothetical protein
MEWPQKNRRMDSSCYKIRCYEFFKIESISPIILLTKWFSDLEELDPPLNPLQGGDLAL